jgi:hypothetical protein
MEFQRRLNKEHILLSLVLHFPLKSHDSMPNLHYMLHLNSYKKEDVKQKDLEELILLNILVYFLLKLQMQLYNKIHIFLDL